MTSAAAEAPANENVTHMVQVPGPDRFEHTNYLDAPELVDVSGDLIERYDELRHLNEWDIRIIWKKKGSMSQGRPVHGKTSLAAGVMGFFTQADFVIWLSAEYCRENPSHVEPLLYRHLLMCDEEELEAGNRPRIAAPDFEGFTGEIHRYRAWNAGLQTAQQAFEQLRLPGV